MKREKGRSVKKLKTVATVSNMRKYAGLYGVIAISVNGYEEYSADPRDYWNLPDTYTLRDSEGEPMFLVRKKLSVIDVSKWD